MLVASTGIAVTAIGIVLIHVHSHTAQNAAKRVFRRFKRKFQSEAFNGLGLFRFITYWFAIRRVLREKRSAQ